MSIMLGDLSASQVEKRLGIEFPKEIKEFMEQTHHGEASNIAEGKWHCFDMPFNIVCGDAETATKIFNSLKDKASECKEALRFSIEGKY